jgi:pimeloyl-ACP methyl ester carboxylesterase
MKLHSKIYGDGIPVVFLHGMGSSSSVWKPIVKEIKHNRKCVLFDFDLYEPTLFTYLHVKNQLNPGDIVCFDEAFDSDERVIIENYFLNDFTFKLLGASVFGIAFQLT